MTPTERPKATPSLPPLRWARGYGRATLKGDLSAGFTVAVMLVPQAMAYAALAGLPPVAGLYASIVPVLVYALLGTSGQLAVGPVAITALLTASAVAPLADGDTATYAALAALLALLAGALQVALGLVRAGALVGFVSHPVIVGFTAGAALMIGATQLPTVLGVDTGRAETLPGTIAAVVAVIGEVNLPTLLVAAIGVVVLVGARRVAPRVPAALVVVAGATAATATASLHRAGVAIVGEVPAGLPALALPALDGATVLALAPSAAAIALVSYAESVSVAKALAARQRAHVDPNQELLALGGANVAASLFSAFPIAGGFSRSAVNASAGARTPLAGAITGLLVVLTVLFLTPLFFYLPMPVLGAVILVAVAGLIDVTEIRRILRCGPADGVALLATLVATGGLGVEPGLAIGVSVSLALFLWRTSRPHTAELGRVEGTELLRNVDRWPVHTDPRFAVLRVDGPLYFANAARVADQLRDLAATRTGVRAIVLDASAITDLDTSAAHELARAAAELAEGGVPLHLATVRGPVRDVLDRANEPALADPGRMHAEVTDAIAALAPDGSPLTRVAAGERPPERVV
jgi:sulfate permease, SulP family